MSALDKALEQETHLAYMARMGLHPQNLARHERRIVELQAERERLFQEELEAIAAYERMTAFQSAKTSCLQPMSPDQYFDSRGEVCEDKASPFHH